MASGIVYAWNWRRPIREGRETNELSVVQNLCESSAIGVARENSRLCRFVLPSMSCPSRDVAPKRFGSKWFRAKSDSSLGGWRYPRPHWAQTNPRQFWDNTPLVCPLCCSYPETIKHLLVDCRKAVEVRSILTAWWSNLTVNGNFLLAISTEALESGSGRLGIIKVAVKQAYFWLLWKKEKRGSVQRFKL
ncbi:hypothetical protein OSB04_020041 [Centaurea solstitialis]|uniref:Uncharacterized protein n=1 Tax=Centaurea solstitialis TaxID=347529 RepID=A0AA38SRZ1_9ASTR|nr:hypothetical protein OSB04_020041 [Centaurea solstitialis]